MEMQGSRSYLLCMHRLLPGLFLAAIVLFPSALWGQGGSRKDSQTARDLAPVSSGAMPDALPSSLDLRPWLPEIGRQTMNDCVAWAFGYAGRSYLEAVDQGWKPDHPSRIFSPTFIYNQINKGVDEGSLLPDALKLLESTGAATLASAPYLPNDFLTQPNPEAVEEAKHFRILDYYLANDVMAIKRALVEGGIVLVCARVNPEFMYGEFSLYTKEVHDRGSVARRPDQPHGYHAMAIVGYNDARQALLFMNSWGKDWGDNGYLWVAYDLLDEYNFGEDKENLLEFAVVMRDTKEPIVRIGDKYETVTSDSFDLRVFGTYADVDEQGRQRFRYTATVRANDSLRKQLESFTWTVPTLEGTKEIVVANGEDLRISAMTLSPSISIQGVATLAGRKTVRMDRMLTMESGKDARPLSMQRHDALHQRNEENLPVYRSTFLPQMSDADWQALESIEYEILSGPKEQAPPKYEHDGGLPPRWTLTEPAYLNVRSLEPIRGFANLQFRDGTEYSLPLPDGAFTAPNKNHAFLEIDWRLEGHDGPRAWYFYQLKLRYPEVWQPMIASAMMRIQRHGEFTAEIARPVDGPEPYHYVYSGYTDVPFASGASIRFKQDHPEFGWTTPAISDDIIEVPTDESWLNLFPDPSQLFNQGDVITLGVKNEYLGEFGGEARYRYHLQLQGTANIWAFSQVLWQTPEGEFRFHREEDDTPGPENGYRLTFEAGAEEIPIRAELLDAYGKTHVLRRTLKPTALRNSALYLDLEMHDVAELLEQAPDRHLSRMRLEGPQDRLDSILKVVAHVPRAWGGVRQLAILDSEYGVKPDHWLGDIETLDQQAITFFLQDDNREVTTVQATPHIPAPQTIAPRLQLEVRDRYWGLLEGTPHWNVDAEITGDLNLLEQVASSSWSLHSQSGQSLSFTALPGERPRMLAQITQEAVARCTIRFQPELEREDMILEAPVHLASPYLAEEARLEWEMGFMEIPEYFDYYDSEPPTPYVTELVASPAFLSQWQSVEWVERDLEAEQAGLEDTARTTTQRLSQYPGGIPRYSTSSYGSNAVPIRATLIAKDGRRLEIAEVQVGEQEESTRRFHLKQRIDLEQRYWGRIDGKPSFLLFASIGQYLAGRELVYTKYISNPPLLPAGGGPAAAFGKPLAARDFWLQEPVVLNELKLQERSDWGLAAEDLTISLKQLAVELGPIREQTELRADKRLWPNTTILYLQAPEQELVKFSHVVYTVTQNEVATEYVVRDRIGHVSDAFELRIPGPTPSQVRAQGYSGSEAIGPALNLQP